MTKYTFTFEREAEKAFNNVLSRLDDDEYTIIEGTKLVDEANPRYSECQTIIEMDPEACLTIRMALGNNVKIRRERTAEEEAAEEKRDARHKVKVDVVITGL